MRKRYLQKEATNTTEKSRKAVLYFNCIFWNWQTLIVFSIGKIYGEKTIEVGVYIDRHLYKNMEEVFLSIYCVLPGVEKWGWSKGESATPQDGSQSVPPGLCPFSSYRSSSMVIIYLHFVFYKIMRMKMMRNNKCDQLAKRCLSPGWGIPDEPDFLEQGRFQNYHQRDHNLPGLNPHRRIPTVTILTFAEVRSVGIRMGLAKIGNSDASKVSGICE